MNYINYLSVDDHLELALIKARNNSESTYLRWRDLLRKFDVVRGRIDPVLNENANLDLIVRGLEDEQSSYYLKYTKINSDARLIIQIQLSRVWLYAAYEGMRTLHSACPRTCMTPHHEKPCGLYNCLKCHVGHVKNDLAVIRIPMAKGEVAGQVNKNPLPPKMKIVLLLMPDFNNEDRGKSGFLLENEGIETNSGSIYWAGVDKRIERVRPFSRRDYSDMLLSFYDAEHF